MIRAVQYNKRTMKHTHTYTHTMYRIFKHRTETVDLYNRVYHVRIKYKIDSDKIIASFIHGIYIHYSLETNFKDQKNQL